MRVRVRALDEWGHPAAATRSVALVTSAGRFAPEPRKSRAALRADGARMSPRRITAL